MLADRIYPITVSPRRSASVTASWVGEVREPTSGTPISAALSNISDEIRPEETIISPLVSRSRPERLAAQFVERVVAADVLADGQDGSSGSDDERGSSMIDVWTPPDWYVEGGMVVELAQGHVDALGLQRGRRQGAASALERLGGYAPKLTRPV